MALAALSPNSVMANPLQANPQVRNEQQASIPQVVQDAQKTVSSARTDTITISPQALKMADDKDAAAEEVARRDKEQREAPPATDEPAEARKTAVQKNAVRAYVSMSATR